MLKAFKEFAMRGNVVDFLMADHWRRLQEAGRRYRLGQFSDRRGQFSLAFVLFLVVRAINNLKKSQPAPAPEPPRSEVLLEEIRDTLAKRAMRPHPRPRSPALGRECLDHVVVLMGQNSPEEVAYKLRLTIGVDATPDRKMASRYVCRMFIDGSEQR